MARDELMAVAGVHGALDNCLMSESSEAHVTEGRRHRPCIWIQSRPRGTSEDITVRRVLKPIV